MNNIVEILKDYNRDIETTKTDRKLGKKLKEIFEANLLRSGRIEISNIQLAEVTGKDIRNINRDMKEEFGEIFGRAQLDFASMDNHDQHMLSEALERITNEIRVEQEPNSRNQLRPVYYFSGLALTQLISRWDTMIRLYVNIVIHSLRDKLFEQGYEPVSISEMNEDIKHVMDLAWYLEIQYSKLEGEANLEHIKENYRATKKEIELKKYELQDLQKKKREFYPDIANIADELFEIDRNNANVIGKQKKIETYGNKKDAEVALTRE